MDLICAKWLETVCLALIESAERRAPSAERRAPTLSPTFASGTATYTALVANSVDEVTVTATENHASADVEIQDADGNALADAGTADGHQVALVEGENVIKVKVTAGDGTATQTYTVTVTRSAVDAPDAPTGFSATKGNRYVTLAWDAPASGANITHHEYHYKTDGSYPDDWKTIPHSATGGFNEDGFTVTKLTNDTAHTFELRAVNAGGGSTAVESSAVTPSGSGRIVESIGVRRDDGQDGDPHGVGDEIRFVVKFSSNVPCASTTSRVVQFNLGSATKDADGYAGDGTSSLWYRYTVLEGDVDSDGIEIPAGPQALPHEYFANNGCTEEFDEKGDARFTRTESEAAKDSNDGRLAAATADVWLLRTGIEGSRRFVLGGDAAGMVLTPSFELGARLDGGDAETGLGVDLGGGLAFAAPRQGVALDLKARGLVAHEASGFREWGASASFTWDPRPSTDRGFALRLRQGWGGSPTGGMDALLARETLAGLAADPGSGAGAGDNGGAASAGRLEAELGYGIALFGGGFTGTPNFGVGLSDTSRDYRLGWRLTSARPGDPGFEIGLDATRREAASANAEHGVMLRGTIRW